MNKKEFMSQLKRALLPLRQSARQEILTDLEEHFKDGASLGKTDLEVSEELGNPKELAQQYLTSAKADEKASIPENVGRGIFVGFGLLLLDAMIVIPIAAGIFAAIIGLWAVPISFFASSIALIIYPFFSVVSMTIPYYLTFMVSIALMGFAAASGIGLFYLSKHYIKVIVRLAKMHYKMIVGGSRG
jgi:uncharacterized membrane protein